MPSTDEQDAIIKQLENRYDRMDCEPQSDGSLKITARVMTVGACRWKRVIVVGRSGDVLSDSGEVEDFE